ncbi:hypothetical protein ACFWFR_10725 [Oerskovia sp. NPDC060287]|uniref:hypothetical protein n=1 Tax=Oerskovia sp. NPDC060287 TaxID=3347095 RepID=UPI00365B8A84
MKKLLASTAASLLALGGLVATAAPASAHTPQVSATCTGLDLSLKAYSAKDNTVTVKVDGKVVKDETFQRSYSTSYAFPDSSVAHSWEIVVRASDGKKYDFAQQGKTTPCVSAPTSGNEVGIYVYKKNDPAKPAAWENSGPQTLVDHKPGTEWYTTFPSDLPREVCGDGWAVQQDRIRQDGTFVWPETITPPKSALGGVLTGSKHHDLDDLVEVPECAEETVPPAEPETPVAPEPEEPSLTFVPPVAPTILEVCGTDDERFVLPESTEQISYARTDGAIVAHAGDGVALGESAGYVLAKDGRSASFLIDPELGAQECVLTPGEIGAVCEADTPYLGYEVFLPEGYEADSDRPLSITFLNPGEGEDYTVEGLPLDGRILWPGASADEPRAWPGWERQSDGTYVETDGNFAWTRSDVEVLFQVNPDYSTTVRYPEGTASCANPPVAAAPGPVSAEAPSGPSLAATGATAGAAGFLALLLVGGGAALVWARRRANG